MRLRSLLVLIVSFGTAFASPVRADEGRKLSEESLFSDDRLVEVDITIPVADWASLCGQTRSFVSALSKGELSESPFTYFRGDVLVDGVRFPSVGIRKKGFLGSLDEERPSLKIKFNEYRKNGTIGNVDRLTLNNNKQDTTLACQFVGYRLYRKAGLPAPRCGLARVTVNGELLGVYSNVESVKKAFLKNEFGDSSGNLYEGTYPADFYVDRVSRFEAKTKQADKDRSHLMKIASLLEEPPENLSESLEPLVDMERFHRFWAMESLIGFWDGYCANQNNYFVYQNPMDSRICFMPWGLDSAFSESLLTPFQPGPASVKARGLLPFRLYQEAQARDRHLETLRDLLDTVWKEKELFAEIDRVSELTKDHRHKAQQDAKNATDKMKAFISLRRSRIEQEIKNGAVPYENPPPAPTYAKRIGELEGTFTTHWADKPDKNRFETGKAELAITLSDKEVTFKRLGVVAEPRPPSGFDRNRPAVSPPTLTFTCERESGGKPLSLWVGFSETQFQPSSGKSIPVQGLIMEEGNVFSMRFFAGTAELSEANRKEGAAVSGSLKGGIFQIKKPGR